MSIPPSAAFASPPQDERVDEDDHDSLWGELLADWDTHGRTLFSRSLWALAVYRFGRWSLRRKSTIAQSLTSRAYGVLSAVSKHVTGVHLERQTRIGHRLHLVHCEAPISIHPEAKIGDRVGIMHNVTIGNAPQRPGAPRIGNDVFIGVGAVIIGDIEIGDGVHVAANSLVVRDVPPYHTAIGVPARVFPRLTKRP